MSHLARCVQGGPPHCSVLARGAALRWLGGCHGCRLPRCEQRAIDGVLDLRLSQDGGAESKRESRPSTLDGCGTGLWTLSSRHTGHWTPDGLWCCTRLRGSLGRGPSRVLPIRGCACMETPRWTDADVQMEQAQWTSTCAHPICTMCIRYCTLSTVHHVRYLDAWKRPSGTCICRARGSRHAARGRIGV